MVYFWLKEKKMAGCIVMLHVHVNVRIWYECGSGINKVIFSHVGKNWPTQKICEVEICQGTENIDILCENNINIPCFPWKFGTYGWFRCMHYAALCCIMLHANIKYKPAILYCLKHFTEQNNLNNARKKSWLIIWKKHNKITKTNLFPNKIALTNKRILFNKD